MADTKCTGDHSVHICEFAKQKKYEIIKGANSTLIKNLYIKLNSIYVVQALFCYDCFL